MRWRWHVIVGVAVVFWTACASARADFEQDFFGQDRSTHDAWFRLLGSRYGCDTVHVRSAQTSAGGLVVSGTGVCVAAAFVTPQRIRAWREADGLREDWEYTGTVGLRVVGTSLSTGVTTAYAGVRGRCILSLHGESERALRVVTLRC